MANIHGLHNNKKSKSNDSDSEEEDHSNDRYVGGVDNRGGGSGLAVVPKDGGKKKSASDGLFARASSDANNAEDGVVPTGPNRVITMYREGFTVDNGPYRLLTDEANREFLTALSKGVVPKELHPTLPPGTKPTGPVGINVSLVDKRAEDYVPPAYTAFSGGGNTIAAAEVSEGGGVTGVVDPSAMSSILPTVDQSLPIAQIQIRLLNGQRLVAKLNLSSTINDLIAFINASAGGVGAYTMISGFPPVKLEDFNATIEEAGLKGGMVQLKSA